MRSGGIRMAEWIPVTERLPENNEWITRFTVSADIISQYRGGWSKPNELHFHEKCMTKMFESLKKEDEEDGI